ncbi:MAG TPA: peroxiredoxin [Treponema sp.]|nr:peroxiredoxin [Treponema sp.]
MAKIKVGDKFPDFRFSTPFRTDLKLSGAAEGKRIILVFLRYYGCTLCQYDMAQYARNYDRIVQAGGKLLVVLQSDPEQLRQELGSETAFPFEIVCDPDRALYRQFEIQPASEKLKMIGPKTIGKITRAQAAGFKHGRYEGEELQLPAAFILNSDLSVAYAQYAKTIDDVPDADQLSALLK